jgi:mRNA interferase MazF
VTPERGQIVWVNFNPQKGHEQSGRRPALVVSPSVYNAVSNCVLVCPITSNITPWPWKVILQGNGDIQGAILVDQIKSIDANARQLEGAGQDIDVEVMDEVLARLATLTG